MGRRLRQLAALALAAGLPAAAGADNLTLSYAPTFGVSRNWTVEDGATVSDVMSRQLGQRYRLAFSLAPYPLLRLSGGLVLDDQRSWSKGEGQPETFQQGQRWTGFGQAYFGNNLLGGAVAYNRQQASAEGTGQARAGSVRESVEARLSWRPADLPSASLAAQHAVQYSTPDRRTDRVTDDLRFNTGYDPRPNVGLRYGYRVERSEDRVGDVVSVGQSQFARATWSDTYLQNRLNLGATYGIGARFDSVTAGGSGGSIVTQALPSAGLSKTLAFSDAQDRVTLIGNPGLVDAVLGAGAGIDLGFGRPVAGDTAQRAMGAQFAQVVDQPAVNRVLVWVDQRLPPEVVAALTFTAWESADNLTWTQVPLAGAVVFGELDSRFEIPLRASTARYLRVDARPLALGVTTDQRYAAIAVTELQFLVVTPLQPGKRQSDSLSGSASVSLRGLLLSEPNLLYSMSAQLSHANHPLGAVWSVSNGLSLSHRLSPTVSAAAQVERSDSGGRGRDPISSNRWGANLAWDPIVTFGANANYSGQLSQAAEGYTLGQSAGLAARMDLYQGLVLAGGSTASESRSATDRLTRSLDLSAGLGLNPHPSFTANASYGQRYGVLSGGGEARVVTRDARVDGAVAYSPFPALSLAAAASRNLVGRRSTQASFSGGFSPFQGGALQLRTGYVATVDTSSDSRTRSASVGLRWNWRAGAYLDASYADGAQLTPAVDSFTRGFFVSLYLPIL